jgi:hypothetical protein
LIQLQYFRIHPSYSILLQEDLAAKQTRARMTLEEKEEQAVTLVAELEMEVLAMAQADLVRLLRVRLEMQTMLGQEEAITKACKQVLETVAGAAEVGHLEAKGVEPVQDLWTSFYHRLVYLDAEEVEGACLQLEVLASFQLLVQQVATATSFIGGQQSEPFNICLPYRVPFTHKNLKVQSSSQTVIVFINIYPLCRELRIYFRRADRRIQI